VPTAPYTVESPCVASPSHAVSASLSSVLSAGAKAVVPQSRVGDALGETLVTLGDTLGDTVGEALGCKLGAALGVALGDALGGVLGAALGDSVHDRLVHTGYWL